MQKIIFFFLVSFVIGELYAGPFVCIEGCTKITDPCAPIEKDIFSENRFKYCGGKPIKDSLPRKQLTGKHLACDIAVAKFLEEIVKVEKRSNFCKVASDCLMGKVGSIPYHINESLEPRTGYELRRQAEELEPTCPARTSVDLDIFVARKDAVSVYNYSCVRNICIPNYSGERINWTQKRHDIQMKRDPQLKIRDSIVKPSKPD